MKTDIPTNMHATISQILYSNRQAFFENLALSLPSQPAIKIGPAPLPSGVRRAGSRNMRKVVPTQTLSTAQTSMRLPKHLIRMQPATKSRVVNCMGEIFATAQIGFPLLVKPNIGGRIV